MPGTADGKPRFLFYGGDHLMSKDTFYVDVS